ncbi:unnamed protein product [Heterobilharzia americana]|nr:unnamed protein product [Heterobilharzia americana]
MLTIPSHEQLTISTTSTEYFTDMSRLIKKSENSPTSSSSSTPPPSFLNSVTSSSIGQLQNYSDQYNRQIIHQMNPYGDRNYCQIPESLIHCTSNAINATNRSNNKTTNHYEFFTSNHDYKIRNILPNGSSNDEHKLNCMTSVSNYLTDIYRPPCPSYSTYNGYVNNAFGKMNRTDKTETFHFIGDSTHSKKEHQEIFQNNSSLSNPEAIDKILYSPVICNNGEYDGDDNIVEDAGNSMSNSLNRITLYQEIKFKDVMIMAVV